MSKQGKAIAIVKVGIDMAESLLKLEQSYPIQTISKYVMRNTIARMAMSKMDAINATPHQHFNAKGKIDKRKVRRPDRKQGFKPHMIRIVRSKV